VKALGNTPITLANARTVSTRKPGHRERLPDGVRIAAEMRLPELVAHYYGARLGDKGIFRNEITSCKHLNAEQAEEAWRGRADIEHLAPVLAHQHQPSRSA